MNGGSMGALPFGSPGQLPGQAPEPFPGQLPPDPTQVDPTPPVDPDDEGDSEQPTEPEHGNDWFRTILVGAGILGAGAFGAYAVLDAARNLRALDAMATAFEGGVLHQGGLQAMRDADLGARFANGIGVIDRLAVATPVLNRVGGTGRLTSVARGHLDHAELLASATALRRGAGDSVHVDPALRESVQQQLESGRPMDAVLDGLQRSAGGARPALQDSQLLKYWDGTSVVEHGGRREGRHVMSAITQERPELRLDGRGIVETGRTVRLNQLVAGEGSRLGTGRGLAEGVGTVQGLNVSTLHPKMQQHAMLMSRVDPLVAERFGITDAYAQRWSQRLGTQGPIQ